MDGEYTLENSLLETGLGGSLGGDFDDDFAPFLYEPDSTLAENRYLDRELSWLAFNQRVLAVFLRDVGQSADGWLAADGGVGPVVIVGVQPGRECVAAG